MQMGIVPGLHGAHSGNGMRAKNSRLSITVSMLLASPSDLFDSPCAIVLLALLSFHASYLPRLLEAHPADVDNSFCFFLNV